jgi:hypothetical protein
MSCKMYNKTLDYLRSGVFKTKDKYALRDFIKNKFEDEIRKYFIPSTTTEYSVFDAILAYKASSNAINRKWGKSSYSIALDGRYVNNGFYL